MSIGHDIDRRRFVGGAALAGASSIAPALVQAREAPPGVQLAQADRSPGPVPTSPANNDFKPGFAAALMNKDLGLAMDAVRSTYSNAPLGSHAAEIYAKFAADHADKDFSAIIEMLRNG